MRWLNFFFRLFTIISIFLFYSITYATDSTGVQPINATPLQYSCAYNIQYGSGKETPSYDCDSNSIPDCANYGSGWVLTDISYDKGGGGCHITCRQLMPVCKWIETNYH